MVIAPLYACQRCIETTEGNKRVAVVWPLENLVRIFVLPLSRKWKSYSVRTRRKLDRELAGEF